MYYVLVFVCRGANVKTLNPMIPRYAVVFYCIHSIGQIVLISSEVLYVTTKCMIPFLMCLIIILLPLLPFLITTVIGYPLTTLPLCSIFCITFPSSLPHTPSTFFFSFPFDTSLTSTHHFLNISYSPSFSGYVYWRLLSSDPEAARAVVLSDKPEVSYGPFRYN